VFFDVTPAPLFFVSSGQINVQVPFEINADHVQVVVSRGGAASLPISLPIAPYAPGIFVAGDGTPIIVNYRTGGLVSSNQPAKVGDVLIIYSTGLGPVSSPPSSGTPASTTTLSTLRVSAAVNIGGVSATPSFAGLAPGFIGLYQVNVTVPAGVPQGNTTLQVSVVGASSNKVPITIGQ
jgi:uncharacterized protein (TIGR03437 family)